MVATQIHIVIDNGTGYMKGGFSGENAPRAVFPTLIGTPKENKLLTDKNIPRIIGQEALEKIGMANVRNPIEKGVIKDWEDMEIIWHHMLYNELRIAPDDHNIILTDLPSNSVENRGKMAQIMFEKFNVQGLFVCIRPILSMYSLGKTSALVLESGDDVTQIVPINEGYYFPYSITKSNLGGKLVTNFLMDKLKENNDEILYNEIKKNAKIIKEKLCRVSLNYEEEINNSNINEIKYKLPDGKEVNLNKELFICPELLFQPNLIGKEIPGIPMQMYNSIMKCETDLRKELYSNMILAGGNTLLNDFHERIHQEMECLAPSSVLPKLKVIAQNERKYTAWIGGALFAGLQIFQTNWVTHSEYQDAGPQIIHRKCF